MMVGERLLGRLELAERDRAGGLQALGDGGAERRHEAAMDGRAGRGLGEVGVDDVLEGDRDAVQRPAPQTLLDLVLGGRGARESALGGHRRIGAARVLPGGDTGQDVLRDLDR